GGQIRAAPHRRRALPGEPAHRAQPLPLAPPRHRPRRRPQGDPALARPGHRPDRGGVEPGRAGMSDTTRCRAAEIAASPQQRGACLGCGGGFDGGTMFLAELAPGRLDKLGNRVVEIYCRGEDFAVYRSTLGVYVHFADCCAREREQRRALLTVAPRVCRLRYLSNQMMRDAVWRRRSGGFYDHEIAEALALALQGPGDGADRILANGEALAGERLRHENRVAYFLSCLVAALLVIGALFAAGLGTVAGDPQ